MRNFLFALRMVFRQLRKSPGFTATAILMLAFGIGATTSIFSIIDGVLLRPLPFPHPDRLVTLGDQLGGTNWGEQDSGWVTGPEVLTYARNTRSFSSLGGYQVQAMSFLGWETRSRLLPCG
jgi:putative ABC transport system permease protein